MAAPIEDAKPRSEIDLDALEAEMDDRYESGILAALQGINKKRVGGIIDKMKNKVGPSQDTPPGA